MGGWEHEGLQLLLTDPVLHRHPPKSLCMNLQGLTGSGSSPTWARLWLVGYLHPISLLLWGRRCGGVPLQPVGYSTVQSLPPSPMGAGVMLGVHKHHVLKHPALGGMGPWAALSSIVGACPSPPSSQLSHAPRASTVIVAETRWVM